MPIASRCLAVVVIAASLCIAGTHAAANQNTAVMIDSLAPRAVGLHGGAILVLTGSGLSPPPAVRVGGQACAPDPGRSDPFGAFLACRLPPLAVAGPHAVTVGGVPVSALGCSGRLTYSSSSSQGGGGGVGDSGAAGLSVACSVRYEARLTAPPGLVQLGKGIATGSDGGSGSGGSDGHGAGGGDSAMAGGDWVNVSLGGGLGGWPALLVARHQLQASLGGLPLTIALASSLGTDNDALPAQSLPFSAFPRASASPGARSRGRSSGPAGLALSVGLRVPRDLPAGSRLLSLTIDRSGPGDDSAHGAVPLVAATGTAAGGRGGGGAAAAAATAATVVVADSAAKSGGQATGAAPAVVCFKVEIRAAITSVTVAPAVSTSGSGEFGDGGGGDAFTLTLRGSGFHPWNPVDQSLSSSPQSEGTPVPAATLDTLAAPQMPTMVVEVSGVPCEVLRASPLRVECRVATAAHFSTEPVGLTVGGVAALHRCAAAAPFPGGGHGGGQGCSASFIPAGTAAGGEVSGAAAERASSAGRRLRGLGPLPPAALSLRGLLPTDDGDGDGGNGAATAVHGDAGAAFVAPARAVRWSEVLASGRHGGDASGDDVVVTAANGPLILDANVDCQCVVWEG